MGDRDVILPKDTGLYGIETFEQMGIEFYGDHERPMFVKARLPVGWKLVGRDYPYGFVVDDKGRGRILVSCDPNAYMQLFCRYRVIFEPANDESVSIKVTDADRVLHTVRAINKQKRSDLIDRQSLYKQGESWLDKHYPDWQNPLAYWETANTEEGSHE